MSATFEPKKPADGWEKRWVVQSIEIFWRLLPTLAPVVILINVTAVLLAYFAFDNGINLTSWKVPILMASGAVWIVTSIWFYQKLIVEDGHTAISGLVSKEIWIGLIPLIIGFMTITGLEAVFSRGAYSVESDIFAMLLMSIYIDSSLNAVVTSSWLLGLFWLPAFITSGMSYGMYHKANLIVKIREVYVKTTLAIFFALSIIPSIPIITNFVYFFILTWCYVGAREIFGGISENGKKKVEVFNAVPQAT